MNIPLKCGFHLNPSVAPGNTEVDKCYETLYTSEPTVILMNLVKNVNRSRF